MLVSAELQGHRSGPKPYEFIRFGDIHGPKPYEFIGFGDLHGPKPYEFIGFGDLICGPPLQDVDVELRTCGQLHLVAQPLLCQARGPLEWAQLHGRLPLGT